MKQMCWVDHKETHSRPRGRQVKTKKKKASIKLKSINSNPKSGIWAKKTKKADNKTGLIQKQKHKQNKIQTRVTRGTTGLGNLGAKQTNHRRVRGKHWLQYSGGRLTNETQVRREEGQKNRQKEDVESERWHRKRELQNKTESIQTMAARSEL